MSSDASKTNSSDKSNLKWLVEKILIPILVALLAAYVSLVAAKILPNPFTTSPALTQSPIASTETFRLAGIWEGTDSRGVLFRLTFAQKCNVEEICGKVELPAVGCTAFPVLVSQDEDTFIFEETNHQNCLPPTGNDTIKLLEDGTLLYGSSGQPATIVLYRK